MTSGEWQAFWQGQATPLHDREARERYGSYAAELRLLMDGRETGRVLEVGCGNGELFAHLGLDRAEHYTGVDFAESMLAAFRDDHPEVRLVCADGHAYRDDRDYDLVFSNGVVQYFSSSMLREHIQNAADMLASGGLLVCASLAWRRLRWAYCRGAALPGRPAPSVVRSAGAYVKRLFRDPMGRWLDFDDFAVPAREFGMKVHFFGCMHYMYRFHAVLQKA